MYPQKRKRLFVGTIDTLFRDDEEDKKKVKSNECINSFMNGDDEDEFKELIAQIEENNELDKFHLNDNNDDELFLKAINERQVEYFDLSDVRKKCRLQAERFKYSIEMFNRIPMWIFRYLSSDDPLCQNVPKCTKLEIMTIFMIINKLDPGLVTAFYIQGGQSVADSIKLHKFFSTMLELFKKTEQCSLIPIFGNSFTFHCETKSLRRVDMELVECGTKDGINEPFIPDSIEWRRERFVRKMIRTGEFTIMDDIELNEVKRSWRCGLRLKGIFSKNK